ncbi:MAG: hypothetical protein NVV70_16905 [Cellulomonas sp.]|nr:hypothetical protein [Cellulomonas sp.]MCR6649726.1 hypothetical protein [Cellulomonas sp.]
MTYPIEPRPVIDLVDMTRHGALLLASGVLNGVLLACLHPLRRVTDWNWRRTIQSPDGQTWADLALWCVLNPRKAWHTFGHAGHRRHRGAR